MKDDPRVVKAIKKIKEEYEIGQIGITEMAETYPSYSRR